MSRVWETQLNQNHLTKIWATRDKLNAASIKNNQVIKLQFKSCNKSKSLKFYSLQSSSVEDKDFDSDETISDPPGVPVT